MADRAKFLDFLDMIDGGGAGKMGGEFKGGGILSQIANLIATPYGSEDPERRKARQRAFGLLDKIGTPEEQAAAATRAAATPSVTKRSVPAVTSSPAPQLRPAGFGQTVQAQQEAAMGLGPFGGAGPQVTDPRNFQRGTEPNVLTAAQRAAAQGRLDPYGIGTAGEFTMRNLPQPAAQASVGPMGTAPASGAGYVGVPSGAGVTLGSNMSGGSQPRMPMQEFAPQGQFNPPAESITRMTSSDFAVTDYLRRNGIPVTMENVTKYRPIVMAAM